MKLFIWHNCEVSMKKIYITVLCALAALVIMPLQAAAPENKNPQKRNFDWQKAQGEHRKMREKFRAEHKKYVDTLKNFHQRYAAEKNPAKKEEIRAELKKFLTDDFNKKIQYSKKRIENMKKFVARLEEQQKNMESKSAEIVEKRTDDILKGNIIRKTPKFKKRK